jgi:hypothetical protein
LSNFFIDEALVSAESFTPESLSQMSTKVSTNNYLWIACQSDKTPYKNNPHLAGNLLFGILLSFKQNIKPNWLPQAYTFSTKDPLTFDEVNKLCLQN